MSGGIALHASWLKAALQIVIDAASWINLTADGGGASEAPHSGNGVFQTCKKTETWETSSRSFLESNPVFFRNQRFKEIDLKFFCRFVKNRFKACQYH